VRPFTQKQEIKAAGGKGQIKPMTNAQRKIQCPISIGKTCTSYSWIALVLEFDSFAFERDASNCGLRKLLQSVRA
jgi:hypothetical protein